MEQFSILIFIVAVLYFLLIVLLILKFLKLVKDFNSIYTKISLFLVDYVKSDSLDFLISNGYKEEAKRIILRKIWEDDEMYVIRKSKIEDPKRQIAYEKLKSKFVRYFTRIGEDSPLYDKL